MKRTTLLFALIAAAFLGTLAAQEKKPDDKQTALAKLWEEGPAAFKPKNEKFAPSAKIGKSGVVNLKNRGLLKSKQQYPKGCELTFDWQWVAGNPDEDYGDSLAVVLRTSGDQKKKWSHEIEDGLMIRFWHTKDGGTLKLEHFKKGQASSKLIKELTKQWDQYTLYAIKIVDTGDKIEVSVDGDVLISEKVPKIDSAWICFYNREPVASAVQVSQLFNLIVKGK
jgi:hypothetical protein